MNTNKKVILKPDKEKPLLNHHHWIFSGAIQQLPPFENGEILPVFTHNHQLLGWGYFNKKSQIIGRMVCFGDQDPEGTIKINLSRAITLRKKIFKTDTTGYRLINGEGDLLPGLVVDSYAGNLVVQIATLGMERLKEFIVNYLQEELSPISIYEKSHLPTRKEEGLKDFEGLLRGEVAETVTFLENGITFISDIQQGQKSGFFLDQREMRSLVQRYSHQKKVLNCFSYSGGFSLSALKGGAYQVDSVDISKRAVDLAKQTVCLNGYDSSLHGFFSTDVFEFLRKEPLNYDLVILDPPAFAKKKQDVNAACRGYKDINRLAIQKMPPGSFLLTCSCSYHVDDNLFQMVVFQAANEAKRNVKIIEKHILASDHPINLFHPETSYLKSLFLYIE